VQVIDWLVTNKEWVFSGIGVTFIAALAALARFFGKRYQRGTAEVVIRIEHASDASRQPDLSASAAIAVERISPITLNEFQSAIESAPPLQREVVAQRYVGQRIEWDTELSNVRQEKEFVMLQLRAQKPRSAPYPYPVFVWCYVKLEDYRELAILPEGAHIRVNGTIEKVSSTSVGLKDARLTFLSSKNK